MPASHVPFLIVSDRAEITPNSHRLPAAPSAFYFRLIRITKKRFSFAADFFTDLRSRVHSSRRPVPNFEPQDSTSAFISPLSPLKGFSSQSREKNSADVSNMIGRDFESRFNASSINTEMPNSTTFFETSSKPPPPPRLSRRVAVPPELSIPTTTVVSYHSPPPPPQRLRRLPRTDPIAIEEERPSTWDEQQDQPTESVFFPPPPPPPRRAPAPAPRRRAMEWSSQQMPSYDDPQCVPQQSLTRETFAFAASNGFSYTKPQSPSFSPNEDDDSTTGSQQYSIQYSPKRFEPRPFSPTLIQPSSSRAPPPRQSSLRNDVAVDRRPKSDIAVAAWQYQERHGAKEGASDSDPSSFVSVGKWDFFTKAGTDPTTASGTVEPTKRRSLAYDDHTRSLIPSADSPITTDPAAYTARKSLGDILALPGLMSWQMQEGSSLVRSDTGHGSISGFDRKLPLPKIKGPDDLLRMKDPMFDSSDPSAGIEKAKKMIEVRKYILSELLTTEENYVRNLEVVLERMRLPLIRSALGEKALSSSPFNFDSGYFDSHSQSQDKYKQPLTNGATSVGSVTTTTNKSAIIPLVDIKIMFACIEDLWNFNRHFLDELYNVVQFWERSEWIWQYRADNPNVQEADFGYEVPLSIGELFLTYTNEWKVYLKFVDNYSAAKEAIRRSEETSPAFRQFLADCLKNKECQRQGIADFLILPIQRVTRYVLLLQDLKKHTPPEHQDYPQIVAALDEMRNLANTVNEVKRNEEEMTRMFYVVRSVEDCPPTIISSERRVLFEVDSVDATRDYTRLALHPVVIPGTGISVVPSVSSLPSVNSSNQAPPDPIPIRIFIFSDLILLAKPKPKKKDKLFGSSQESSPVSSFGSSKNEKFTFFRLTWLKDIEIVSVDEEVPPSPSNRLINSNYKKVSPADKVPKVSYGSKNLVRVVIHNSDAGTHAGRRRIWTDLAKMNSSAAASKRQIPVPPRLDPRFRKAGSEVSVSSEESISPTTQRSQTGDDLHDFTFGMKRRIPSVSSIERMAIERISTNFYDMKNPEMDATPDRLSPHSISPKPYASRSASLISGESPNIAALLDQMVVAQHDDKGMLTVAPSNKSTKGLAKSTSDSKSHSEFTVLDMDGGKNNSDTNPMPMITETFVLELPNKKRKKELLLVVERLILEKKMLPPHRMKSLGDSSNDFE